MSELHDVYRVMRFFPIMENQDHLLFYLAISFVIDCHL